MREYSVIYLLHNVAHNTVQAEAVTPTSDTPKKKKAKDPHTELNETVYRAYRNSFSTSKPKGRLTTTHLVRKM